MEDINKLRRIAGLPTLSSAEVQAINEAKKKKKDEVEDDLPPVDDDAPPADIASKGDDDGDEDDLPAIVTKIAKSAAKKFGIDEKSEDDVAALQDFLMKVYDAGCKDGVKKAKDDLKESIELLEWSASVKTKVKPPEGLFADGSVAKIVSWLHDNHADLKSAMGALNFYINRAGKNLSADRKAELDSAKEKLRKKFGA